MVINNARISVLKTFLENPKEEYTIRALSRKAGINYRLSYEETMKMKEEGIISIRKQGQGSVCKINLSADIPLYAFIESLRTREFIEKHANIRVIAGELSKLSTAFCTAVLFGSHAKEKAGKNSDIDILVVAENAESVEASLSTLSYPLHITAVSEESFIEMKRQQTLNVANEAIGNHIILAGHGIYCGMLAK